MARHKNGREVEERLAKGKSLGHPWMIVFDGEGNELVTSVGPGGNIGCPVTDEEQAHFITMMHEAGTSLTDDEIATLRSELAEFASTIPLRI